MILFQNASGCKHQSENGQQQTERNEAGGRCIHGSGNQSENGQREAAKCSKPPGAGQLQKDKRGKTEIMEKAIITVVGPDCVGIIAKICIFLAENNINVLDISQTITGGYFNMMMIVDTTEKSKEFGAVSDEITALGKEMGLQIKMQREDIFNAMHRI